MLTDGSVPALAQKHMESFAFYWKDGTARILCGVTVGQAFKLNGYGIKDLKNLSFYATSPVIEYEMTEGDGSWNRIQKLADELINEAAYRAFCEGLDAHTAHGNEHIGKEVHRRLFDNDTFFTIATSDLVLKNMTESTFLTAFVRACGDAIFELDKKDKEIGSFYLNGIEEAVSNSCFK